MYTHFYLSLLQNEGIQIEKEEKLLICNAIFSNIETGLVKTSMDSEIGISALVKSLNS